MFRNEMEQSESLWTLSENILKILSEPWHDKTNNVAVRSAKTQISLGIRPVRSESSLALNE